MTEPEEQLGPFGSLLDSIRYRVPRRKVLLFVAAFVRGLGSTPRKSSPAASRFERLGEALEEYAEGRARYALIELAEAATRRLRKDPATRERCLACARWALDFPMWTGDEEDWAEETEELCDLLREFVGPSLEPIPVERRWLAWNNGIVATLARTIQTEKNYNLMPVLADALEDAGCADRNLLSHCREERQHFPGCWVIDLLAAEQPLRRSLADTWRHLESAGWPMPRTSDRKPFVPRRMPRYDDEKLGFSFFRTMLEDADLSNLTLRRTYFGRSGLENVRFRNTDLSQSCACWNDFIDCDFSGADLSGCDLRSSVFTRCRFVGANLTRADLRRSSFEGCDFTGAILEQATADTVYSDEYELDARLSEAQKETMRWSDEPGPEPDGG